MGGMRTFTFRFFAELYGRLLHKRQTQKKEETGQRRSGRNKNPVSPVLRVSSSPTQFIIVLDNYQEISDESPFQRVVIDGLSAVPEGIIFIVISRNESPRAFAQMRANRQMEVIGWDALKLRFEEAREIVRLLRNKSIPDDVVQEMHKKTEGWAAGLVLLAGQTWTGQTETPFQGSYTLKEIFDYFAGVILEQTGTETRAFLEKTSFFRKFTPEMARELTRNPKAARILSNLNRNNYFTQRHATQRPVYEYHSLFREFLLARTRESFPAEDLSRIRHEAAAVCEAHGQNEDAVELFLQEEAWEAAIGLILQQAPALLSQGRGMTLWAGLRPYRKQPFRAILTSSIGRGFVISLFLLPEAGNILRRLSISSKPGRMLKGSSLPGLA